MESGGRKDEGEEWVASPPLRHCRESQGHGQSHGNIDRSTFTDTDTDSFIRNRKAKVNTI